MKFIIACLAWLPSLGLATAPVYELGLDEKRFEIHDLVYFIEPASVPLDLQRIKNSATLLTPLPAKYFPFHEVKDQRVVMAFLMKSLQAMTVYLEYPWASPLKFSRFIVFDAEGQEIPVSILREKSPLWTAYVQPGLYTIVLVLEPLHFSDAKTSINVMNGNYMTATHVTQREIKTFIYGIGISFIFFNFSMFILHRKVYFIYYVLYSSTILYLLAIGSSHAPYPHGILWNLSLCVNALFSVLMSASVLRLKEFHHHLFRTALGLVGLGTFLLCLNFLTELGEFRTLGYLVGLLTYFICVYAAIRRMLAGYVPAIFIASGWGVLFIGYLLNFVGLYFLNNPILTWSAYIAYALESMLFAVALAYRTRDSEERAVQEKTHALSQLEKVVYPHQMLQMKAGRELESTMPTTSGQACVLSLDIIGSSKIKHINAKEFFRGVFTRCNAIMSEGYDGIQLRANAYRIKEVGDGFLCAVGYPFLSLSKNPANDSVDLAKKFARVLAEEAAMLHSETPISCGIGIALDSLTGFYPEAGTKEYDLYGPAIVLATRYEGMRKTLFEAENDRSVLIIQDVVYQSLDPSHRSGFVRVDLKERGIIVRDDPAASRLYYQFLDSEATVLRDDKVASSAS